MSAKIQVGPHSNYELLRAFWAELALTACPIYPEPSVLGTWHATQQFMEARKWLADTGTVLSTFEAI